MASPQRPSPFDTWLILALLGRVLRTWSFAVILVLGLAATGARAYSSRPVFRSETVVLYRDRAGQNVLGGRNDAPSARRIALVLQQMLFSRALLEKLVSEFGLYPTVVARVGLVGAVEEIQKKDLGFSAREGYAFRVSYESISPDQAQKVAARAADLLIHTYTEESRQDAAETTRFLDSERKRVEEELRQRESELALFTAQHPEIVQMIETRGSSAAAASADPGTAALGLEMQALQLRERLSQLRRSPNTGSSDSTSRIPLARDTSEARGRAEAELAAAQRELAEKRTQFTDEYPDVKKAVLRVESAKAHLRHLDEGASAARLAVPPTPGPQVPTGGAGEGSEREMLQQQLELVEKQVRAVRAQSRGAARGPVRLPEPPVLAQLHSQYTELDRRARESRDHLGLLESRQFQAQMQSVFAAQAERGDLMVADPAYKPIAPVRSSRSKILAIGIAGSLVAALFIGLLLVIRDDRIRCAADLRRFGLPDLLCEVPPP